MGSDWNRQVRERAYAIWESRGRPEGASHEDWVAAEREIADVSTDERVDELKPDAPKRSGPQAARAPTANEKASGQKRSAAAGSAGERPAKVAKPAEAAASSKKSLRKAKDSASLGAG